MNSGPLARSQSAQNHKRLGDMNRNISSAEEGSRLTSQCLLPWLTAFLGCSLNRSAVSEKTDAAVAAA